MNSIESNQRNVPEVKPEPESEVRAWMNELEVSVEAVDRCFDRIRVRLSDVLRDEPPLTTRVEPPDECQLTPLASRIRDKVRILQAVAQGCELLLDQIEL